MTKIKGQRVQLPMLASLIDEAIAGNDGAQAANVPATCTIFEIIPEGGACYYSINGAATTSSMYVPEDNYRIVGPIGNLSSLSIHAASGVTVHLNYLREGG